MAGRGMFGSEEIDDAYAASAADQLKPFQDPRQNGCSCRPPHYSTKVLYIWA